MKRCVTVPWPCAIAACMLFAGLCGTAFAQDPAAATAPADTGNEEKKTGLRIGDPAALEPAAGGAALPDSAPAGEALPDSAPAGEALPDSAPAGEAEAGTSADFRSLDEEVQELKKEVIELNKDLFVLEEELLFPANTQVAIFLSLDVGTFFAVDSVTLKIDDREVANYLYTAREAEALQRGGVHRMFLGNLKVGKHELVAFFTGNGTHERDYKRGATLAFEKGIGAKYLELQISDRLRRQQPEFIIREWE